MDAGDTDAGEDEIDGGASGNDGGGASDAGGSDAGGSDAGSDDAGGDDDGGASDAGGSDGGSDPSEGWTWVPVEGSRCASGATAGIGVNLSQTSDDVLIYMQGGGACWNQGTCVPSLLRFGPVCHYGDTICLYDGPGGAQPTATFVTHPNPFPADGGGVFPSELRLITGVRVFDRDDVENPFRDATFVYVPYCTGDMHTGDNVKTYKYKHDLFGPEHDYTFHFAGAANMELYLEELAALRPNASRVWLTGTSAGGYGATFHLDRVARFFPDAEVALLADSSPFVDTHHWDSWKSAWNMQFPEGCDDCDEGFQQVMAHVLSANADKRIGLLAFDSDQVIRYFFHGGNGIEAVLDPPSSNYTNGLNALLSTYDAHPNAAYFVLPGTEHVMWGGYGTRTDDGYTAPRPSPDGETNLKEWIDAWATGAPSWSSVR